MDQMTIEVERRQETGKNSNRRLRAAGMIPAVVYGAGKDSVPIQVRRKTLLDLMKTSGSDNPVFLLKLAGTGQERHGAAEGEREGRRAGEFPHAGQGRHDLAPFEASRPDCRVAPRLFALFALR